MLSVLSLVTYIHVVTREIKNVTYNIFIRSYKKGRKFKRFQKDKLSYEELSIIPTKEYDYSMKLKMFVHSFSNLRIVHIGDVHLINIFM